MSSYTKESCLADLKRRILELDLPPGAPVEEASLTARYGMSRTPLREVLQRLAGAGFITIEDNRGAKVASMDITTMRSFFQTAPMVYANIGRLAAENRTDPQLKALEEAQAAFRKATTAADAHGAALANHRFHLIIGGMAHNPYLLAALERLLVDHTRLGQTFYRPASDAEATLVGRALDQHDAMITAIAARQPEEMADLTLEHWSLSRDRVERFVRPDPLPLDVSPQKDRTHAV